MYSMALYTLLTKKNITKLIFPFGLAAPKKIKGILEGTVNTYYQLSYPHKTYFLKIDEVGNFKRLQKELKILLLLKKINKKLSFKTPIPLKANKNSFIPYQKKYVLLFEKIKGKSRFRLNLEQTKLVGKSLAALHYLSQNKSFSPHRFHLPELKNVYKQIKTALVKKHPMIDLEIRQIFAYLAKNKPSSLPCGLIHADLFPENILWGKSRLSGILDFEAAGLGPFILDIATTLNACCHDGKKFLIPQVKSFLKGYQSVRKITKIENDYFKYALTESSLRFLLTRLRDFELKPGKIKAKPFKDYREYVRRFGEINSLVTSSFLKAIG